MNFIKLKLFQTYKITLKTTTRENNRIKFKKKRKDKKSYIISIVKYSIFEKKIFSPFTNSLQTKLIYLYIYILDCNFRLS